MFGGFPPNGYRIVNRLRKILSSPHAIADSTCEIGGVLRKRALLSIFFSLPNSVFSQVYSLEDL